MIDKLVILTGTIIAIAVLIYAVYELIRLDRKQKDIKRMEMLKEVISFTFEELEKREFRKEEVLREVISDTLNSFLKIIKKRDIHFVNLQEEAYQKDQNRDPIKEEELQATKKYYSNLHGEEFIKEVDSVYEECKMEIDPLSTIFPIMFTTNPSRLGRQAIKRAITSLPDEYNTTRKICDKLIVLSCKLNCSVHEILSYMGFIYDLTEFITVPFHTTADDILAEKNQTIESDEKWRSAISAPQIILCIAAEKTNQNYEIVGHLDKEFRRRSSIGLVPSSTFKELTVMARRLEQYLEFGKQNDIKPDELTVNLVSTINNYLDEYLEII